MNDFPNVEDLVSLNILLYDKDIVDGSIVGKLARRSMQRYKNTVRRLKYNNHICYVNTLMQSSNLYAALIVTLFSTDHSIWRNI